MSQCGVLYGLWNDMVWSPIKYFHVCAWTSCKTLSYKSPSGADSKVYVLFFENSSSQIIFWNFAQERKSLWFKKSKLAALINVVNYHWLFKNSGSACIFNLYQL